MNSIIKVIGYEWKKIIMDFLAVTMLFAGAAFYSVYYPFPYSKEIVRELPVGVVDMDKSDLSMNVTTMLNNTENLAVKKYSSMAQAKTAFFAREIYGIIYIPYDFYKLTASGKSPAVSLFSDSSYLIYYSTAMSAATEIVLTTAAGAKIQKMNMQGIAFRDAVKLQSAANLISKPLYNPKGGYAGFVSPAVYTLIVQQVVMIVLLLIQGTSYETGYRYPKGAGAVSILAGKVIAYLPIFLAMFAYFFTIGPMIFNMPVYNNLIEISIFALPYGLAVIFFAVSLSFFAREREAVLLVVLMTSIPFLIISGFMWPSWMMPEWVVWLSKLIPSTAGISGFVAVRQLGADIRDILPQYINLWVLVFGYMITALMSVKWQLKQRNAYEE